MTKPPQRETKKYEICGCIYECMDFSDGGPMPSKPVTIILSTLSWIFCCICCCFFNLCSLKDGLQDSSCRECVWHWWCCCGLCDLSLSNSEKNV